MSFADGIMMVLSGGMGLLCVHMGLSVCKMVCSVRTVFGVIM
jgi:hypothetical protein